MGQPGGLMQWGGAQDAIALTALILAIGSFAFTFWLGRRANKRDERIEKSTAYLQLEVHSSEAFRFAAANSRRMAPYAPSEPPRPRPSTDSEAAEITRQYYYQCLNLFEVCANFRRNGVIAEEVFASWVAWFHEVLDQWYFRELWAAEMRDNYTRDIRNIFDVGFTIYRDHDDPDERRQQFYLGVCHVLGGCEVVGHWLELTSQTPKWPAAVHGKPEFGEWRADSKPRPPRAPAPELSFRWNEPADRADAAAFAGKVIGGDRDYISHGEIQTGLSPDGKRWAAKLGKLYAEDFADLGERDLLVGRDGDGAVRALLIVAWEETPRLRFAVLEDMAVDPALRSAGVGGRLLEQAEQRVKERGVDWVFLESGLHNEDAHRFFERHGFEAQSKVFARRLRAVGSRQ